MFMQNVSERILFPLRTRQTFVGLKACPGGVLLYVHNLFDKDPNYNLERPQAKGSSWRVFMI